MTDTSPTSVSHQIADLLAWARRLSEQGHHADPTDRSAYHTTKAQLLADLADPDQHDTRGGA